jgi:uncharacterized Rossmann fold enzyme
MEFDDWEPVYEAILADFGYDRQADRRAREVLAGLCGDHTPTVPDVDGTVAVAGAGPSLAGHLERAASADTVFAASSATLTLRRHGVGVDCMVTDLDGSPETAVTLTREGTPVAVHAHGDNVDALETYLPEMAPEWVLATTQAAPRPPVHNPGGFTDGDRAAFLADEAGADALVFAGWDLDDVAVGTEKRRKLRWAGRLLAWLEQRRGEQFPVLDDRRETLLGELPPPVGDRR